MPNDLTFFTNEPNATLLDRFKATLQYVQFFDVLVGYFHTSGFHLLQDALDDVEKIRILVGLSVDRQAFQWIDAYQAQAPQLALDFHSSKETKELFGDQVAAKNFSPQHGATAAFGTRCRWLPRRSHWRYGDL
ncbi:MAG: hypothetical protein KatS3mg050_4517 [Litorilinea sp.]|nr:MAG: hypothetical protein KatS3mg050_4517 [Litorilinea sp.]